MNTDTIQMSLFDYFMEDEQFTIPEATALVKEQKNLQVNDESIRARIYEGLELGIFKRVARGVYKVESQLEQKKATCLLINGDGRDLSFIEDNSIDGIITDHPYDLAKSLTGGNRKFATYELFKYTQKDFQEKMRVLKEGAFCVEFLPEENEVNYQYLYEIKQIYIHLERCMPSYMNRMEKDLIRSFKATRSYNIQKGGGKHRRNKDNFKYK